MKQSKYSQWTRVEPTFSLGQHHPHNQTALRAEELLGSLMLRTWPQVGKCSGQDWWVSGLRQLETGKLKVAPYLPKLLASGLKHEAVATVPWCSWGNTETSVGNLSLVKRLSHGIWSAKVFSVKTRLSVTASLSETGTVLTHIFSLHLGKLRQGDQANCPRSYSKWEDMCVCVYGGGGVQMFWFRIGLRHHSALLLSSASLSKGN